MNNAANQAAWRKRQADKIERYEAALTEIAESFKGRIGALSVQTRRTALEALNPPKTPIKDTGDE